jgi:hypothetical protein
MSKSADAAIPSQQKQHDSRARKGVQAPAPVAVPAPALPEADRPEGSYLDYPILGSLPELLLAYRDIQLQLAAMTKLEADKKRLGQSIEALLLAADAKSVTAGALRCTRVEVAGRKTLSSDKLLALGVPADTIVEATVVGNPSSYVKVTAIDEDMAEAKAGKGQSFTLGSRVA